jgi:hypothetical protein
MATNTVENNTTGTSPPNPAKLTPEAVIEQIRALRSQIEDVTPLSKAQRNQLRQRTRKQPAPIVDASISVIGSSDTVAQAVGQPLGDVLQIQTDSVRWGHLADELRSFLKGSGRVEPGPPRAAGVHRGAGVFVRIAVGAESGQCEPGPAGGGDQASEELRTPQEGGAGPANAGTDFARAADGTCAGDAGTARHVHSTESVK